MELNTETRKKMNSGPTKTSKLRWLISMESSSLKAPRMGLCINVYHKLKKIFVSTFSKQVEWNNLKREKERKKQINKTKTGLTQPTGTFRFPFSYLQFKRF